MPEWLKKLMQERLDAYMASEPELRLDANETAVLVKQLEHMLSREQEIKYAPLKALMFFPANTEIDAGAETYTYPVYDERGVAKIIANYANDLPQVGIESRQVTGKLHSIGVGYSFSRQDVRRAAKSGVPLQDRKRRAALRALERLVDTLASTGDAAHGIDGALNHPNITILAAADPGTGTDTTWNGGDKTNAEIIADLNAGAKSAWIATKENFQADTLLLPPERFTFLTETPYSTQTTDSIATVFLKNTKFIKNIDSWGKLSTAGANGGPAALYYARNKECVEIMYPMKPQFYEPQVKGLMFEIPAEARVGGVAVYEPLTLVRQDLI
jgi:hypothetical protein